MSKLYLCSNFQDESKNIPEIWELFKDVIEKWVVVDSGSTDGSQDILRQLVGDRLILVESDMIKQNGYGFSRTKLIEYAEGADWCLIWDGDERMSPEDVAKLKALVDANPDYDMIRLPRCHFQDFEMTKVEYGSMDKVGTDYKVALAINQDYQPRLIRRIMIDGKSKVQFYRRVHEWVQGVDKEFRDINSPVIFHFGWMKSDQRKKMVADLCDKLYHMDLEKKEYVDTYEKENIAGTANVSNPWNIVKEPTDVK